MKTDVFTLAHEVKNPLCVAKGYLEMMNEKNYSKYREIINKEIDTSLEILDNYLELNKLSINKEEIDLNVLLKDIDDSFREYLKLNDIELIVNTTNDDIYLMADYNKLRQVIYNILKNSLEWQSKKIIISYKDLSNKVKIIIENDGEKIDDDKINNIGKNISYNVLGNGIGLHLSKRIINLHGGTFRIINNQLNGISTIISLTKK